MADLKLGIKITSDGAGNVTAELTKVDGAVSKLGNSVSNTQSALSSSRRSFEDYAIMLGKAHLAIMAVQQAYQSLQGLVQTADAWTNLNSRLKVVTGSHEELATALADVSSIANRYQADINSVGAAYNRLAPIAANMGKSQSDLKMALEAVSSALKLSGASVSESSETLRQFGQALSGPTVQMEEMNTIIDSASVLWQGLQRQFPQLIAQYGSLKEAVGKGALSNRELLEATIRLRDEFDRQASTMRTTVSGGWRVMLNEIEKFIGGADEAIGVSKSLADGFLFVSRGAETASNRIVDVTDLINRSFESLESRFPKTSEAFEKFVDKVVGGWKLIAETIVTVSGATLDFNKAISKEEWQARGGGGQYTTGGGFGGEEATKPFFDGVKKGASESALALTKLTDKQKAVAQIVIDTAKAYKVDPAFALAIAQQESGFNQLAKSAAGARGVMQLMPGTAKQLGVNFSDLNDNIKGGVLYLSQQEKQFKSLRLAAAAYNAGPGNVQKYGGVPPFKETQNYVTSVGALYQKWQQVLGAQGEAFVSAKDQADELTTAFKQVQTHHDDNIKKADEYARVQVEKIKTQLAAMDQEREAAARLTAEQLAGAKTYEDKARIIEAAQAKAAEYNAQALEMVRAEYDAQQQSLESKKQAYQAELAQADKYNVSIDDQFKLKQAIRAADNDLLLLAENRAQAEITAAGRVNEFAKQSADLKRNEASAIDGIIAAYQRQADILDRLTAAKQAGASADQLALLNDYYQSTGNLPELVSQDQIARMQQYILSTQALKGAVDELTGSQKKNQEQAVKEQQLRENAFWDQLIGRAQEYASVWQQIGENSNDAFATMMVASNKFIKNVDQISKSYKEMAADGGGSSFALDMAEGMAQAQNALNMVTQSLILVRNQYEKGTAEYQKYDQAAAAVAVAAKVAAIAEGVLAVVHQMSSGDPYSAIPRALAVAAMLASMGISTGASGSGGISAAAQKRQETQGTGTVLGDTAAQSNSIAASLDIIRENSSNDLNYSAAMLRALEDLSLSILALANNVAVNVMPSIDAAIKQSGMKFGMSKISLFSGFNKQLTDAGIGWFEQSLTDILNGTFDAKLYADITKSFEVMGSVLSSSTKTYVAGAGAEVNTQITRIFTEIVKAFTEGGKAFGMSAENVLGALEGFTLAQQQISLKDMTMEEQQQALNAVFSNITDQMAEALNQNLGLALQPFQKAGEGMAQTFLRVSEGISRASGELERLGLTAISYRKVINKQGDVTAEIVRQSLAGQKHLSEGVRKYVNELMGKTEDIIEGYKKLIQASNLLKAAGIGDSNLDRTMIEAAGGLSAFNAAMEAFNENFVSEADRYAGDVRVLAEQFGKLGYTLPTSKEGFLALVQGIDTSTVAGKKLFGQMIALSESFAQVANEAQAIRDKYAAILDPFKAISDQIQQVGTDFGKLIGGVSGDSQARIDAIGNAASDARDPLFAERNRLMKRIKARFGGVAQMNEQIAYWERKLEAELAKAPKKQNKEVIKTLRQKIERWSDFNTEINDINQQLADILTQEGIDKAAESARLALEKQAIIDDARQAMGSTLEDIFTSIVQTIQQAQQRLQSVLDLQKSIASQIAQLQGPQAVFGLASTDRNNAFGAIDTYINTLSDGRARDVGVEVGLLNTAQQAVMAKYNAEVAAIQEAQQAYIAAETEKLNAALQLQIDAINAATDAAIEAENDRLNAAIKVQQKIDEAAIKSQQKQFDAANKLVQKQFDAEQKALQKAHDTQLKALSDELDAANKLKDAIKSVADYAQSLKLGQNSTLSPEARLAEAQRQYQTLVSAAQGGDVEAMSKLAGASDAYLEAAKTYYGSSTNYQDIFDGVQRAMESIGGMSAPDPDSIQSRIDLLREAQAEQMDALRESQADRLDAIREIQADQLNVIREAQQDNLDAIRKASQDTADAIRKTAQDQIEAAQKATQQAIADLSDPTKNEAMRAAREAAERDLGKLAELAELTRIEAAKQAEEAKRQAADQAERAWILANNQLKLLDASAHLNADQLAALNAILANSGLTQITPTEIPTFAKGGYAKPGLALVGEQGPEIVRFERPAQVMTADETRDALRGGNDGKIVQAIAELKAEMRAVVVTQSNANPQIINKLTGMEDRLNQIERTNKLVATSK